MALQFTAIDPSNLPAPSCAKAPSYETINQDVLADPVARMPDFCGPTSPLLNPSLPAGSIGLAGGFRAVTYFRLNGLDHAI